jgi:hypothetical protein
MTEHERGTDRLGRRAKRFLSPSQKYEIWLQLVRGETTISEAADRYRVDRSHGRSRCRRSTSGIVRIASPILGYWPNRSPARSRLPEYGQS